MITCFLFNFWFSCTSELPRFFFCNLLCFVLPLNILSRFSHRSVKQYFFLNHQTLQVIHQFHFCFFRSLSSYFNLDWLLLPSWSFLSSCAGFPISQIFCIFFYITSSFFWSTHILVTWWLNYLVLRCLRIHFILLLNFKPVE